MKSDGAVLIVVEREGRGGEEGGMKRDSERRKVNY